MLLKTIFCRTGRINIAAPSIEINDSDPLASSSPWTISFWFQILGPADIFLALRIMEVISILEVLIHLEYTKEKMVITLHLEMTETFFKRTM